MYTDLLLSYVCLDKFSSLIVILLLIIAPICELVEFILINFILKNLFFSPFSLLFLSFPPSFSLSFSVSLRINIFTKNYLALM